MSRVAYKNWLEEREAKGVINISPEIKGELDEIVTRVVNQEEKRTDGLTKADVEALTERFLGLSPAEQMIFVDLIPVEMCLDRIHRELERAKKFEDSIKGVVNAR